MSTPTQSPQRNAYLDGDPAFIPVALTQKQFLECAQAFESQLKSDGDLVAFDDRGQYKSVLHRSQWRKWLQAWSASMQLAHPSDDTLYAPRPMDDSLLGFLNNCKVAGVFFNGQTATGKPGVFFISMRQINEYIPNAGPDAE